MWNISSPELKLNSMAVIWKSYSWKALLLERYITKPVSSTYKKRFLEN